MAEKRFREIDILRMNPIQAKTTLWLLESGCWNLLGMHWEKEITWHRDILTGDLVFNYE